MSYKSVDIGKDMFLNDVYVGQKVLYLRAAPGGVGIGEVTKIEIVDKRSGNIHIGWKYGYNDAAGKNASYIIYVYLPNGVQISWHTNNYYIYKSYPLINAEWDGQVCMTMEKLLTYIDKEFLKIN